jgi:hypothetical protein
MASEAGIRVDVPVRPQTVGRQHDDGRRRNNVIEFLYPAGRVSGRSVVGDQIPTLAVIWNDRSGDVAEARIGSRTALQIDDRTAAAAPRVERSAA